MIYNLNISYNRIYRLRQAFEICGTIDICGTILCWKYIWRCWWYFLVQQHNDSRNPWWSRSYKNIKSLSNIQCRLWIPNYAKHAFKRQCCGTNISNKADLDLYGTFTVKLGIMQLSWKPFLWMHTSQKNATLICFEKIHRIIGKQSSHFWLTELSQLIKIYHYFTTIGW